MAAHLVVLQVLGLLYRFKIPFMKAWYSFVACNMVHKMLVILVKTVWPLVNMSNSYVAYPGPVKWLITDVSKNNRCKDRATTTVTVGSYRQNQYLPVLWLKMTNQQLVIFSQENRQNINTFSVCSGVVHLMVCLLFSAEEGVPRTQRERSWRQHQRDVAVQESSVISIHQ